MPSIGIGTLAEILAPGAGPWVLKNSRHARGPFSSTALNLVSVEGTGRLQGLMVIGLLGILALYIVTGGALAPPRGIPPFFRRRLEGIHDRHGHGLCLRWRPHRERSRMDVAEEVKAPQRSLPLGMFLSYAVVKHPLRGRSLCHPWAYSPGTNWRLPCTPVQDGAAIVLGTAGAIIVGLGAFLAYATTGNAGILSASRSPMAMSRDGLLPGLP